MKISIKRYNNNSKVIYYFVVAACMLTAINFALCINGDPSYRIIILLPIVFSVLLFFLRKSIYINSPGIFTLMLICFFRYEVTPLAIFSTGELSRYRNNYDYLNIAIVIMIYELISIFLTMAFFHPLVRSKNQINNNERVSNRKIVFIIAIIAILFLYYDHNALTGNFSIFSGIINKDVDEELSNISGLTTIVWQACCAFFFSYILYRISKNVSNIGDTSKVMISVFWCYIYYLILFTGQSTISRWYVVVTAVASTFWLMSLYPKKKTIIIASIGIPFLIGIAFVSILKNIGPYQYHSIADLIQLLFSPSNTDTYFAGPVNVNNAIGMKEHFNNGIYSLPFDIINNMPIVTNYIDKTITTIYAYNLYLGRGDQIIPLVGQSFTWFGYILSPALSVLSVILIKRNDLKYTVSIGIEKYFYAFLSVWCGIMIVLNMTIWFSWIYSRIIPFYCIIAITKLTFVHSRKGRSI